MSKKIIDPERIDQDNPEWTDEDVKTSMRLRDLPGSLQRKLRGHRGPQKAPVKVQMAIPRR